MEGCGWSEMDDHSSANPERLLLEEWVGVLVWVLEGLEEWVVGGSGIGDECFLL